MRKAVLLLLLILVPAFLCAVDIFRSNQLMQKLQTLDSLPSEGYALVEESEDAATLYLDGKAVMTRTVSNDGEGQTVTETDLISVRITKKRYSDGRILSDVTSDSDGNEIRTEYYGYVEGRLAFVTTKDSGSEVTETLFFLRSSDTGEPFAVKTENGIRFFTSSWVYEEGELYEVVSGNLILKGEHSVSDDGNIIYMEGSREYVYLPDGRILSVTDGTTVRNYIYEENKLVRVETATGSLLSVEYYSNGSAVRRLDYEDGELTSETELRKEGNIRKLYSKGRLVATVYYRSDNRTVDRIEYN